MLADYLKEKNLSAADFRRRFEEKTGEKLSPPLLSMWLHGKRTPGRKNALLIQRVTRGRVRADSWPDATVER